MKRLLREENVDAKKAKRERVRNAGDEELVPRNERVGTAGERRSGARGRERRERGGEGRRRGVYSTGRDINTARQVAQKKTINYFYRMEEKQTGAGGEDT